MFPTVPDAAINSIFGWVGVVLFIFSILLLLGGLGIVNFEKISVQRGRRSVAIGVLLFLFSGALMAWDLGLFSGADPGSEPEVAETEKPTEISAAEIQEPTQVHTATPDETIALHGSISEYFKNISEGDYRFAFDQLTPSRQAAMEGGFAGYEAYWRERQLTIEVDEFKSTYFSSSGESAEVLATVSYISEFATDTDDYRFCMVHNRQTGAWLINHQNNIEAPCSLD